MQRFVIKRHYRYKGSYILQFKLAKTCFTINVINYKMNATCIHQYGYRVGNKVYSTFFNQYDGPRPDLYGRYIDDCIGAISSSREELNRFITSVNSFHPALKYTWEISETSLAFLDIKVSISGNGLCTSVHYKPTDSHSYLLHSSSIPYS